MNAAELCQALFRGDPYESFDPVIAEPDLQGWNGLHAALVQATIAKKPGIIVDLGVWKGQSSVTLAQTQREHRPDGFLIAIDTFLGSPEHWSESSEFGFSGLSFRHGQPRLYDVFLSNVVLSGLRERIVPLAQTSENAAVILQRLGVRPDLVHVDAAHEYAPALRDIETYYDLLAPGGLLMGDDFYIPSVARAVVHFTDRIGRPFRVSSPKWWISKPGG